MRPWISLTPGLFMWSLMGVIWFVAWGVGGAVLARSRGREAWLGAVICVFLGAIGIVILVVLPEVPSGPSAPRRPALDIAAERYARGEITREQFEQLKVDLA